MRRETRWWLAVGLAVVAVGPMAWAEREKKPAKPPARAPDRGLKPPAGKPAASARPEAGAMVRLEGGSFRMGSDSGDDSEKPVHEVTVATFWMDVTEVTVAAYKACVDGGGCPKLLPEDSKCNGGKADRGGHPINCVDWSQAMAFCRWANKRLPTEEEWEFAARLGGSQYPWGEGAPGNQLCWNGDGNDVGKGKRASTCAVGSFAAGNTKTGLKDMAGNVSEWTATALCPYSDSGYITERCALARVSRGGNWNSEGARWVRATQRYTTDPENSFTGVGLRCARSE